MRILHSVSIAVSLLFAAHLTAAPTVTLVAPTSGATVSALNSISITFNEPVTGVLAGDFLINGEPALAVSGSGAGPYLFSFPQPPAGVVTVGWDSEQVVSGIGTGQLESPPAWTYTLTDGIAPTIGKIPSSTSWTYGSPAALQAGMAALMDHILPTPGSTVAAMTWVEIVFSEAVTGVDAADLLINGQAATAVTGERSGPYRFSFPPPAAGVANFSWAAGHGIVDLSGNAFTGAAWTVTVGTPGAVQITEFLALNAGTSVAAGSDADGVRDENWDLSPWIELHNPGASAIDLLGWSLTDDIAEPKKWIFPARSIAAGARLVVFASAKDRKPASGNLHTNFDLSANGGTLALFPPDAPATAAVSSWINYPAQRYDYSYGALPADGTARYFSPPSVTQPAYTPPNSDGQTGTPTTGPAAPTGAVNSTTPLLAVTPEPRANVTRGFFSEPFSVTLSCTDSTASIRYTLDGSPPVATSTAATGPLSINGTTVLRIAAFGAAKVPSRTVTHTYLFPEQVCPSQPSPPYNHPDVAVDNTNPAPPAPGGSPLPVAWGVSSTFTTAATLVGFPTGTATTNSNNLSNALTPALPAGLIPADYGMDVKVWADPTKFNDQGAVDTVNGVTNRQRIERALRNLPALSLVIKSTDFFGTYPNGQSTAAAAGNPAAPLYPNSHSGVKTDLTKACSLELLEADGETIFAVDAGVDLHGNASRDPFKNPKHGFTLRFKGKYGASNLEADLYPDSPVKKWDKLVLRGDFGGSWLHQSGGEGSPVSNDGSQRPRGIRIREAFSKESFRDMGRVASHHRFVNLFINGVCWGSYELMEDEAEDFTASYMGGDKDLADVIDQKNDSVLNNRSASLKSGTWTAWSALKSHLGWTGGSPSMDRNVPPAAALLSSAWTNSQHETLKTMLDLPWFVDYMIWQTFAGHRDWANDNSDAARYMKNVYFVRPQGGKFRPLPWDMENLLWHENEDRITGGTNSFNPSAPITAPSLAPPVLIHPRIKSNAEYRVEFGDRAWKHLVRPGGALTPAENIKRLDKWTSVVGPDAICLESARWGDYRYKVHAYASGIMGQTLGQVYTWNGSWYDNSTTAQYDGSWASGIMKFNTGRTNAAALGTYTGVGMSNAWLDEIRRLRTIYFPARSANVLTQYRNNGLYPHMNAPELRHNASNDLLGDSQLPAGTLVKLVLPPAGTGSSSGEVFYTLDGTDPRVAYDQTGTPRNGAILYNQPFAVSTATIIKARTRGSQSAFPRKNDVRAASIASVAGTYAATGGVSARGQLTATPNTLDGISLAAGDRILLKNQSAPAQNGIWVVTTVGTGANGVWDRAADWDGDGDVAAGTWVRVNAGLANNAVTVNEGSSWRVSTTGVIVVGGTTGTSITFATQQFSPWSALMEINISVGSPQPTIRISEIHYNPPAAQGGSAGEFVEFLNFGPLPVDMTSWSMEGITFTFPAATVLEPGQRLVIASNNNPAVFAAQYPGVVVTGYFGGNLSNGEERLALLDEEGNVVTSVTYGDQGLWPVGADNGGYSLEMIDVMGDPQDPTNYRASAALKGTPGAPGSPPAAGLEISEFLIHGAQPFVEIVNNGTAEVSTAQHFVEVYFRGASGSAELQAESHTVPLQTLAPGGRLAISLPSDRLNALQPRAVGISNSAGEIDFVRFGPQAAEMSFSRIGGTWALSLPTPGAANLAAGSTADPASGRLNEFLADPVPGADDWLEITNLHATLPLVLTGLEISVNGSRQRISAPAAVGPGKMAQFFCDPESIWADAVPLKLPAEGASLALLGLNGETVDATTYTAQSENVSTGRLPNGTGAWGAQVFFTPGQPNHAPLVNLPVFNEVLVINQTGSPNPWAERSGWVEIKNPAATAVSLTGWKLRPASDPNDRQAWIIPPGVSIPSQGHLAIWCDSMVPSSTASGLHLNFSHQLDMRKGLELLTPQGEVADRLYWGWQLADRSIGRDSAGVWTLQDVTTRGATNSTATPLLGSVDSLKINEWNGRNLLNTVEFPEFVEIYNTSETQTVNLAGLWLGDEPSEAGRRRWQIPPLSYIGPKSYVTFGPDTGGPNPFGYPFRIDNEGEYLRLSRNDAMTTAVDAVSFGLQGAETTLGRAPDGSATIAGMVPTPGLSNATWAPPQPPVFTIQPKATTFRQYSAAGLVATATGGEVAYQWFRNGVLIPDATDIVLNLFPDGTSGQYHCLATNEYGSTSSNLVTVQALTKYQYAAERENFGLPGEDDDGDGILNALEFLMGTRVNESNGNPVEVGTANASGSQYLTLTLPINPDVVYWDLQGTLSTDLLLWSDAAPAWREKVSLLPDGRELTRFHFLTLPAETRQFLRLKLTP